MSQERKRMASACWDEPAAGTVHLTQDWVGADLPPLFLEPGREPVRLRRAPAIDFGEASGYFVEGDWLVFVLNPARHPEVRWGSDDIYIAGEFNGWGEAIGQLAWRLAPGDIRGRIYYQLKTEGGRQLGGGNGASSSQFKFVTGGGVWLEVPPGAPNAVYDRQGARNYRTLPGVTGHHVFHFEPAEERSATEKHTLLWSDGEGEERVPVLPGHRLLQLASDRPLGARIQDDGRTTFVLFAPRATQVLCHLRPGPAADGGEAGGEAEIVELAPAGDGCWEGEVAGSRHGWFYSYRVEGTADDPYSHFDGDIDLLDPYALATAGPAGPGIVWDHQRLPRPRERFQPPSWHDLVIVEAHVRDLLRHAPDGGGDRGDAFARLADWVEGGESYFDAIGANAVELLPVVEFGDSYPKDDYHWGYMPVSFFAPESSYASAGAAGVQVEEFARLVEAFHRRGLAVILDVVYNHVGEPNHLLHLDKFYYFDLDPEGLLINWSGCGNTLRCGTPMATRLIVDSLVHLVEVFDVDGFRFDLAELIGLGPLKAVEAALKAVKPSIVLIAEPWSYRGNLAPALKSTGYAFWNDGFREFLPRYLRGEGSAEELRYFMAGSLGGLTAWPAQTVNYVESHDDQTWIDRITQRPGHKGENPTEVDRRRTHLLAAILMASLGIPMITAGQDALRTKLGHSNTYRRGDLNGVDYGRAARFPGTHAYFRSWIRFRLSPRGAPFRLGSPPRASYFQHLGDPGGSALATVYNADGSAGERRLFFAVNPHKDDGANIPLEGLDLGDWTQLADHERFDEAGLATARFDLRGGSLHLPPLTCGLWESPATPGASH